jgi:hypothetical protein
MIPAVSQYAGQQLLTGQQAEAYADHSIAVHVADMTGGKTYAQVPAEAMAQPNNAQLQSLAPRCSARRSGRSTRAPTRQAPPQGQHLGQL